MFVRRLALATLAAAGLCAAAPAFADSFDGTQAQQQQRIREGVRSGQLTRHEAMRLEEEQEQISRLIRRARMDGHVDRHERHEIERAQDTASRHIYAEKHDGESRDVGEHRPQRRWWWHRWNRWN